MRSGWLLFLGVALLLVGGGWRLARIQQIEGLELRRKADSQHIRERLIPAQRGAIVDCKGRVLAGSMRRPLVFMDTSLIKHPRAVAESVGPTINMKPSELERLIRERTPDQFVPLARGITKDELTDFMQLRRAQRLRSFDVQYEPVRVYPHGRLAVHTVGFVGDEQKGQAGVEHAFDSVLHGVDGRRRVTIDVKKRAMRGEADDYEAPIDGATVVLSIDTHIQQRTEHHLRAAFEEHKPEWAVAIVMDPLSGEVLASAALPDYDPTQPIPRGANEEQERAARERMRNRSVSDAYEPGSIFKPFIAAAAIDSGLADQDETFTINGPSRSYGRRTIHDTHAYDRLRLWEIVSKSSNIGMGMLALRCGNTRLHEFIRMFGFGDLTGIELRGEHPGLVYSLPRWTDYSTQSVAFGQEISATPIQLLTAFCVFCNDGVLLRPRLVRGVIGADGELLQDESLPIAIRRVLSEEATRRFRMKALVEVVNSGTGTRAHLDNYQVFGKTGTAQIAATREEGGGYIPDAYVGSFMCGAPAAAPRVAVLVSLFRPAGEFHAGGTVAAPAAAAIVQDVLEYMRVPPDARGDASPPIETPLYSSAGRSGDEDWP